MAKTFRYIDITTGQPGMDPLAWIETITDPVDKANCIRLREEEGARSEADPAGDPSEQFQAMFQRYLAEANVRLEVTEG